jgi:replicative DNA helicase
MTTLGKRFIAALVAESSVVGLLEYGAIDHVFRAGEVPLYEFVSAFARKYHALPQPETIEAHTGEELPDAGEPHGYYFDLLELRHIEHSLKRAMKQASDCLQPDEKDPKAALEAVSDAVMQLIAQKQQRLVVDFRDAYDTIMADYVAKFTQEDDHGVHLGWATLDDMAGGLVLGDMLSIVGRPAQGKTMQMLYCAHHAWKTQQRRVLFVSMEMKPLTIQQRLTALHAHLPMTKVKNAELSTKHLARLKGALLEIKSHVAPFWVVDGNFTATVEDIWMLARQLAPEAIYVDGGYLLKHPRERDRYKRVAENADLIKQDLSDIAPVACSWQFSRNASRKAKSSKKQDDAGLEDIGYTDAIGQASSLVLGLFEEDSVETIKQRRVSILKGRNGEIGQFSTRWNWLTMDFTEILVEQLAELKFV